MERRPFAVAAALLVALSCAEPYPGLGGTWEYASSLTFPADFDIAPGQPYVCTYRTALTLDQSSGIFNGTYDTLTIACNTGGSSAASGGAIINGALDRSGILSFDFDSPAWVAVGTLHGDSMGGTVTDSVSGMSGMEQASGTWKACKGRVCQ
jgi:hypothetical protein